MSPGAVRRLRLRRLPWLGILVSLVWLGSLSACRVVAPVAAAEDGTGAPRAVQATDVSIAWASTNFTLREPEGAAVELRVIVRNRAGTGTDSTSIRWDPAFAAAFQVVGSDPPAWRTRVDDAGWGSLDTAGVLPKQTGEFRVWFAPRPADAPAVDGASGASPAAAPYQRGDPVPEIVPTVEVIAEGVLRAGVAIATPLHHAERQAWTRRHQFERGQVAQIADQFALVPASGASAFPAAVGLASLLLALAGGGICAALVQAARREAEPVLPVT